MSSSGYQLRKCYSTPLFPPKRVRSCQPKVLERRRQSLEQYLQAMLRFGPSRAQVLSFLGVKKLKGSLECMDFNSEAKAMEHQPIYNFKKDPYIHAEDNSHLPDVVTQGVLLGLYGNIQ
ncbi:Sorting nexin-24 [Blattella germanica]|nr:Sorting nexin-24 [Blattella germanica]